MRTRQATPARLEPALRTGDVLGRYRIEERLGAGGMGVVYRAFDPQLQRAVALKIMRPLAGEDSLGHASEAALREARALAQLSHPNVVEIFDVGMFGGQLFLAMELLHGMSLTKWLVPERPWQEVVHTLSLAGRGLAAAHARGVVHRDFKPENVVIGDDGSVRVVDFGLATQQATPASERPHHWLASTESRTGASVEGVVAGTPPYMSPEQLRGELVDARSDQFSFCVALFRALHRVRPYQGGNIEQLLDDMQRRGGPIAVRRRAPAKVHRAMLRGLSLDPAARWPHMDALLAAIEPRPRRRGLALAAVGAVAAASVVTFAATRPLVATCEPPERARDTFGEAARQRMHAALTGSGLRYATDTWARFGPRYEALGERWLAAYGEVCEAHRDGEHDASASDRAMACLQRSLESARTLVTALEQGDPASLHRADQALAAVEDPDACMHDPDALDSAELAASPEHLELQRRVAEIVVLERLGRLEEALAVGDEVRAQATDEAEWRLRTRAEIHSGYVLAGLGRYEQAVERLRGAALAARARHHDGLAARAAVHMLIPLGQGLQRPAEAEQWQRFAEASLAAVAGHDDLREALLVNVGGLAFHRGDHAAALEAYAQALVLCERNDEEYGCDYITLATCPVLEAMGRYDEAKDRYARAIAGFEAMLGPWHPKLATPVDNLGIVLFSLGDYEGAAQQHARSLEIREAALGPDNAEVGLSLTNLGLAELELQRLGDARVHQERAVAIWRASLGEEHPYVAAALTNLALVRRLEGASEEEIIALHRQALAIREAALGPAHPEVGTSLANLGNALQRKGEADESRRHLDRARASWVATYGEGHARVASIDADLGDLAGSLAAWDEAVEHYSRARQGYEAALGPAHTSAVWLRHKLGNAELERGRLALAKPLLEEAQRSLAAMTTEAHRSAVATFGLARLRAAEGEREQARTLALEAKAHTLALEATDVRGPELRAEVDVWLAERLGVR